MDLVQIKQLLKIVAESGVAEVEIEEDDFKLIVRKNAPSVIMQPPPMYPTYGMTYPMGGFGQPMPAQSSPPPTSYEDPSAQPPVQAVGQEEESGAEAEEPADNEVVVRAPIVGTFYGKPAPDEEPFFKVGDDVRQGDVLCIIEAMKLMNEIECEVEGRLKKILVEDAQPVEYDQPLFVIET
jgi:acetyl-CoA carboxylase biotin carboxyl carrier protein